jgi:UDP-N-acetylmuramoyl-tripeptide--D-alanyl-D-alanine ligase
MIAMELAQAARVLGLDTAPAGSFRGVTSDSRKVREGMLFAALPGERVDGHEFVARAAAAGASAALVSRPVESALPQLQVDDVLQAMGLLASAWREQLGPTVLAITGSNGKTTT